MAKRPVCTFDFVGHPTTAPNTPEDEKRIKLSQWLTRLIGDEYVTPGANGYTEQELAAVPARYAHLRKAEPVVDEAELQLQALALLRAGVTRLDIIAELSLPQAKIDSWREEAAFLAEWETAKAEGSGKKVRSSARHDALTAQRVQSEPIQPQPSILMATHSDTVLQEAVLQMLRDGKRPGELVKSVPRFSQMKLATWRKDLEFARKWDEAKEAGRPKSAKPAKATAPKPEKQAVDRPAPQAETPVALTVIADAVNGPLHYNGNEVIDQMARLFGNEAVAMFCRLNAYKYRMRAGKKPGNSIEQDISKALWYENYLEKLAA